MASEGAPTNVEIAGKSYPSLADGKYDVIVLGTGLTECIVAGLLAVEGKKVLQVDRNNYYGSESASLNLTNLYRKFRGEDPPEAAAKRFGPNRDWNVDLVPKLMMARGRLVKILLRTGVSNYLEFKNVDGSFVYKGGKHGIYKVPATEMEALKTPLMGFFQKRHFRSFLQFVSRVRDPEFNPAGDAEDLQSVTMKKVYERFWLDENSQDFTGHAMALQTSDDYLDQPAAPTVRALKLYAYSLEMYGKSPFIYPMYGLGGLPEGFSRLCAIKGGTFMLNTPVDEVLFDDAGRAVGVRSGEQAAAADFVIGEPTYFPSDKVRKTGRVVRSIFILDHPVPGAEECESAQIIIPFSQVSKAGFPDRRSDIYLSVVSYAHMVAGRGMYVAIASTTVETNSPASELEPAARLLGNVLERFDSVSDTFEPVSDGADDGCYISKSYDATSHFETTTADVLDLYRRVTGAELDLNNAAGQGDASSGAA